MYESRRCTIKICQNQRFGYQIIQKREHYAGSIKRANRCCRWRSSCISRGFDNFKKLFLKLFETGIESTFEKELEKYRNKLSRADRAFEILLNREMHYYEKIEPIFAEIVPLEHDLFECLKIDEELEREAKCESFKVCFGKYTELIKMLKNEVLLHQAYIPKTVFKESTAFVVQMQDDFDYWFDMAKCLFAGEYGKIDYAKGEKTVEMLLEKLARWKYL